jgi:prepilin-type N-terminal cleavage/methylation domain-containing protein
VFERYRDIQKRRGDGDASESGFTLIELLIVIVVLGILAAIVVFSLSGVTGQSRQAACTADAKSVEVAADAYQAQTGAWPTALSVLTPTYLHSLPNNTNGDYTIGLNSSAVTYTPKGGSATVFADSTGCVGVS